MTDFRYISFGAGVQSTALLVLSALELRGVPKADAAIFADTGDEPAWVYEHLEFMKRWSREHGIEVHEVAKGCLSEDLLSRPDFVAIPAFTPSENGKESGLRRQCTREYKITPIEKCVRKLLGYEPRQRIKENVTAMIGISLNEVWRMKESRIRWITNTWPLVDAGLRRGDCINLLQEHSLPVPRKSSCVYCPYHGNEFWRDLKQNHPHEWQRAVRFDRAIRHLSKEGANRPLYVHRTLLPLAEADLQEDQLEMFGNECEGYCGV
jgi:hypothetical protein